MPGIVIRSEMPRVACISTSSALRNASSRVVSRGQTVSRRWFLMVIRVSTCSLSSSIPLLAFFILGEPSIRKGSVTMPTVRAP